MKQGPIAGSPDGSHLKATEWAYLAGIVDGEGCISISRSLAGVPRAKNPRFQVHLVVINTYQPLMDWLVERFGGVVIKRSRDKETHKFSYRWRVSDHRATWILRNVRPYLAIKHRQCDIALDYIENWNSDRVDRRLNPQEVVRRTKLFDAITVLNRRGVAPAETKRRGPAKSGMR